MHEYIKRSDAINEINRGDLLVGNCAEWAREIIWRTPYSDVAPVKRGHWIEDYVYDPDPHDRIRYKCSECDLILDGVAECFTYCPNCGAKMDGD